MQYLFLLYRDDSKPMTPEQGIDAASRQWAILDETTSKGILRGASPLPRNAPCVGVRASGDSILAIDGPFAETKEALAGFYVLECVDLEEAKYWAGRLAQTGCATGVEIRPLATIPARPEPNSKTTAIHA